MDMLNQTLISEPYIGEHKYVKNIVDEDKSSTKHLLFKAFVDDTSGNLETFC